MFQTIACTSLPKRVLLKSTIPTSSREWGWWCIECQLNSRAKSYLGYKYLGEHSVKNIAEPVRVYRVLMDPEAAGKVIGEKRYE
ncbi:MAG: hypothetical protein JRE61_06520 [Deltaproteobacteria bacterium]|nr:hypothetical protein [Deltaproteobacteria bacterium]MBW2572011.1 hypothetical protein [Deltaproteobacteria bacterium]